MRRIDNVSPFNGLIFDRYLGDEDAASDRNTFASNADLLFLHKNKHDGGIYFGRVECIQKATRIFKNARRELFQNIHSLGAL